jgi:uncharacterized damage-inducible protein DinB
MPTTAAPPSAAASQAHMIRLARASTKKMLEGIPQDKLCAQPGSCINHALWIMGHLASSDDYFLKEFGGGAKLALSESWHTLFGMGAKPVADPSKYPSVAEVRKAFDERHAAWVKWVESLTAAQLRQATPEGWRAYAPTLGDLPLFAAWHEGYHAGQLAPIRRGLGLGPAFG